MGSNSWKNLERKIAKDIGGKRVLNKGISAPDVILGDKLIVEAKRRKTFSLKKTLIQIEEYRKSKNQILVIIRREPGKNNLEVFMKYSNLRKLVKSSLRKVDFVVQLNYKDFVDMAVKLKKEEGNEN
jgi:hypothetical protein